MKVLQPHTVAGWLAIFFIAAVLTACSGSNDIPNPDEPLTGEEEYIEMSAEKQMHYRLLRTFYNIGGQTEYQPSRGIVLDEAKPSERSLESESYELALKDFERFLTSTENTGDFIKRGSNGITVSLDTLGSVKFSQASGNGVVAKAEISLNGAPEYTILYRHASSFGDNELDLRDQYAPGDYVSFECRLDQFTGYYDGSLKIHNNGYKTCGRRVHGVVIEVKENYMYVFTSHTHSDRYEDHWKVAYLNYNCVTDWEWREIYDAWHKYRDDFIDTYHGVDGWSEADDLYRIMEGSYGYDFVCAFGDDRGLDHNLYCARNTFYSKTLRIKVDDLRKGITTTGDTWKAYRKETYSAHCGYYWLYPVHIHNNPKLLYPVN